MRGHPHGRGDARAQRRRRGHGLELGDVRPQRRRARDRRDGTAQPAQQPHRPGHHGRIREHPVDRRGVAPVRGGQEVPGRVGRRPGATVVDEGPQHQQQPAALRGAQQQQLRHPRLTRGDGPQRLLGEPIRVKARLDHRRGLAREPRSSSISSLFCSSSVAADTLAWLRTRLRARRSAGSSPVCSSAKDIKETPDRSTKSEQKSFPDFAIPWFPLT
ncbi:hypothetical protein RB200_32080 [Streptomyces sp. PmtG]